MSTQSKQTWREPRDRKLFKMLDPDEPAWLIAEEIHEEDEVVYFTIVHRWKPGGWAKRRYTYDTFSDVIHFRGTSPVDDSAIGKMKADQRLAHHHVRR